MTQESRKAVILLSGGLDSATVLAVARDEGFDCHALSFAYGQRHAAETQASARVAESLGAKEHRVVTLDAGAFGGSALTDFSIDVPKGRSDAEIGGGIPVTYVPARNTVFLAYALAWAETLKAYDIFIGVNALDYSGYPDCRPAFIDAFEQLANLATAYGEGSGGRRIRIHAPLLHLNKAQIIGMGLSLGVDYALTLSCYDPKDGMACGMCDSCRLRLKGFREHGAQDPARYARA